MTFDEIREINARPQLFEFYTADKLWTDEHTAKIMLGYHLNENIDVSSRNKPFIERSSEWIANYFEINENTSIADFGCGPGLYTTQFAQRGANVTGIDFSGHSINYARQSAKENRLDIQYIHANYLDYESTEQFDLITIIMCDYCALSPVQRKELLQNISRSLKPHGSILLDVYSLLSFEQKCETATYERNLLNGFWSAEDYYCFINTYLYQNEKVSLDKYTIVQNSGMHVVYNWLQHFSRESLQTELEANGFTVGSIFSNVAGDSDKTDSPEFAAVATKG